MPIDCLGEIMFERTNVSPHMAIFEVLPVTLSGRRLLRLAAKGSNPPELHVPTSEASVGRKLEAKPWSEEHEPLGSLSKITFPFLNACRSDGVIPSSVKLGRCDVDCGKFIFRHLDPGSVRAMVESCMNRESFSRGGVSN